MNPWPLYRRIESALTPEFEIVEADQSGVLVIDDDGTEWHLIAKAEPAVPIETAAGWPWGVPA